MNKRKKRRVTKKPKTPILIPVGDYRYVHLAVINLLGVLNDSTLKETDYTLYNEMKDAVVKWNMTFLKGYARMYCEGDFKSGSYKDN